MPMGEPRRVGQLIQSVDVSHFRLRDNTGEALQRNEGAAGVVLTAIETSYTYVYKDLRPSIGEEDPESKSHVFGAVVPE